MTQLYDGTVPATLGRPFAWRFWMAVVATGIGAGLSAVVLTLLLQAVQGLVWPGQGDTLLVAASAASPWRHLTVLAGAGVLTAAGQYVLVRLSSGNSIDITAAIWFSAGRLPALRTLGTSVLSVVVVGMGASLGREGAPKQAGAVIANVLSDRAGFSDEQRRLLVACGAGAGMSAAYGVPVGGALFSVEVLRGTLALRLVLPALLSSVIAAAVAWLVLPNAPTYLLPAYAIGPADYFVAVVVGIVAGFASILFVRAIAIADRYRPTGIWRFAAPVIVLTSLGIASIALPQILGNGHDIVQLALADQIAPAILVAVLVVKPLATMLCVGGGVPGGLFTPTLAIGALLGAVLGKLALLAWPGSQPGLMALLGAGALLAATTQGPLSAIVLIMELTGHDRSFAAVLILAVVVATLISRTIDPRSIYDARLTDRQVVSRMRMRDPAQGRVQRKSPTGSSRNPGA